MLGAARFLLSRGHGEAKGLALSLASLLKRGLQAATVNRRLAGLRSLVQPALRRWELVTLDLEDVNLQAGTVAVLGNWRTQKETMTLPEPTKAALVEWLEKRGADPLGHCL